MYNKIKVNEFNINCYNNNCSGLLSNCHFIYSVARSPYIMPALLHFGAGFFMSQN